MGARRRSSLLAGCLLTVAALGFAETPSAKLQVSRPVMGTVARITVYAADEDAGRRAIEAAFARIEALESVLSDYRPDSELSLLTERAYPQAVLVTAELFNALLEAQHIHEASGGAFDVTLGRATRAWRQARSNGAAPGGETRRGEIVLDVNARTVRLTQSGTYLDLGGIGKGFAADHALAELRRLGFEQALVAVGGDLAIGAPPPGRAGWRVGIDSLGAAQGGFNRILELTDCAVSTSGDTSQFIESGGIRYSHILRPETGQGLTDRLAVTVIARQGVRADGLATAVSVMGVEAGLKMIETQPDAEALVFFERDGRVESASSSRFPHK